MKLLIVKCPPPSAAQRIAKLQLHILKYEAEAAIARQAGNHRRAARIETHHIAALRSVIRMVFEEMSAGGELH